MDCLHVAIVAFTIQRVVSLVSCKCHVSSRENYCFHAKFCVAPRVSVKLRIIERYRSLFVYHELGQSEVLSLRL